MENVCRWAYVLQDLLTATSINVTPRQLVIIPRMTEKKERRKEINEDRPLLAIKSLISELDLHRSWEIARSLLIAKAADIRPERITRRKRETREHGNSREIKIAKLSGFVLDSNSFSMSRPNALIYHGVASFIPSCLFHFP